MKNMPNKVLIVCNDYVGSTMAGPGIRAWELGRALARRGTETAVLARRIEDGFAKDSGLAFAGQATFRNLLVWLRRSDWIIQTGRPVPMFLAVLLRKRILFDQYDPVIFEFLEKKARTSGELIWKNIMLLFWRLRQKLLLAFGEGFLVANEKQKDFLIGQLTIRGYNDKLDSVSVLPFGLPQEQPVARGSMLRGTRIKDRDFLLVWGGGIWDWFDPFTLLAALAKIRMQRNDIKAYFPGLKPPNPDSVKMAVVDEFLAEARRLDLLDSTVFINNGWMSYEDRADYLLESDVGVSLHRDSLEARFAFRTRMLDYLWAGLPIIASKGDCWADSIESRGLGITVSPGDVDGAANAIMRMADDGALRKQCRDRVRSMAAEYRWDELVMPLSDMLAGEKKPIQRER